MRQVHSSVHLAKSLFASFAFALLAATLAGCATGVNPGFPAYISAPASSIRAGDTMQIANQAKYSGSPVVFSVNGVVGGNATVGTIDSNGMYTAPALVPAPSNVITITSTATNYPDATPGSVTLSVLNPIPIIATVTPSGFSEGSSLVTVTGSKFVYGAQIVWNGIPVPTTMVSDTELAAEISAPKPGTFPLYVANPDPGAANSYTANELVGPGQVVLKLNTYAGTSARVNNSINIGIDVTGTDNPAVTWTLNGTASGNAQIGTIVSNPDGSVTYTAPAVVPIPSNIVNLTAVSVDNPKVSISQGVAILNPIPVLNSATPNAFDPPATATSATTVVLTGSQFIAGAQLLVNGSAVPTTFNSGNQLTATFTPPTTPGPLDLQVLNPSPGPATSTDLIATVTGPVPTPPVTPEDASRFLAQATFGATDSEIHNLSTIGYSAWLNQQFNTPQTLHTPDVNNAIVFNNPLCAANDLACNIKLFLVNSDGQLYLENSFWQQAITANDQLRQRVKYSLSEMFVISGQNGQVGNAPRGMANFYDLLGYDAFTNFRQLLQDVTLNPMMGMFLNVEGNDKGDSTRDPDENYAREVMQLFTIGLYQLNPDGTQVLDVNGNPVPTYGNPDVMGLAKVFTGFSFNIPGDTSDAAWGNDNLWISATYGEDLEPMRSFANHHSTEEKDFLGVTIPASSSPDPDGDLKIALDTLFNHPNLPPFFSKQMIQHLVTSNPSPAYVERVAKVFIDNGNGVRGDMKAVITAILTDPEARGSSAAATNPQYGKVREALLRYTEWARAFTAQSRNGGFLLGTTEDPIYALGQMTMRSPTVFNWYAPGYVPPGTSIAAAGLVAPEMGMTDVSTVVGYLNYMQSAIGNNAEVFSSYSTEVGLANNPDALLDRINLLLMAGEMDPDLRSQILTAVNSIAIPDSDQNAINAALTARVQTAIYLTMAAPSYASQF
jgi:uncharacterized protein (DUF1800 family)